MIRLKVIAATSMFVAVLSMTSTGLGYAQTGDGTARERPNPTERADNAQERRQQREADRAEAIDSFRLERTTERCAATQDKFQTAMTRAAEIKSNRADKYAAITAKLENIITRLDVSGIDSSELSGQVAVLGDMVSEFKGLFDIYQLALEDAASIDCVTDTEGFILALDEARSLRDDLKTGSAEIKTYIRGTIIDTLNKIKQALNSDDSAGEEEA